MRRVASFHPGQYDDAVAALEAMRAEAADDEDYSSDSNLTWNETVEFPETFDAR